MLSSLLVLKKYFTSERSEQVKYFSTLEEKFRISARPCNILYIHFNIDAETWEGPEGVHLREVSL